MKALISAASDIEERNSKTKEIATELPVNMSIGAVILAAIEAVCVVYITAAKAGYIVAAAAVASGAWASVLHRDIIRIPMLAGAVVFAMGNLFLLWKAWHLRNAPSAAWRKRPLKKSERWRIGVVLAMSLLAIVVAASEMYFHHRLHHTLI